MNIFPNAIYRFVYRNWDLLPAYTLARFLGCTASHIRSIGRDLGLPHIDTPPFERILPAIVRRNWHMIPREQIADLVGMEVPRFNRALQEIDFLDVKLGHPPPVRSLRWKEPSAAARTAARRLAKQLEPHLAAVEDCDPPFSFIEPMSRVPHGWKKPTRNVSRYNPCIFYSYVSTHGDFLRTGEDPYPDGILARLADRGVNAVWMPALFQDLATTRAFPELGKDHRVRIKNLRRIVRRAGMFGIEIFLYLNEPRGMPKAFFDKYPDERGMPSRMALVDQWGLCTSTPRVQDHVRECAASVFKAVPDLGGAVLITASEYMTNCYSHFFSDDFGKPTTGHCPRCEARGPEQVVTDAARLLQEGLDSVGSTAQLMQWLWAWNYVLKEDQFPGAMAALPKGMPIIVDWARGKPFEILGKKATVDEYSLAHVEAPSPVRRIIKEASRQARPVVARAPIVTSVEMNAQPYLPVMPNVVRLFKNMRQHKVTGFFGSWIFGAYPGRNMELLVLDKKSKNPVKTLARKYYGKRGAEHALKAWNRFSKGLSYLPESQNVLYFSPINGGVTLPLALKKEPWRHGMVLNSSDHIDISCHPFGPRVVIKALRLVVEHWTTGITHLARAVDTGPLKHKHENERDLGVSIAGGLHYRSGANHIEFMFLRDQVLEEKKRWRQVRKRMLELIDDETEIIDTMIPLVASDSRIGFEGSAGYYYRPMELIEKLLVLEATKTRIEALAQD